MFRYLDVEVKVRVRDLLERKPAKVYTVAPSAHVDAAISQMMAHDVGGLPVVSPTTNSSDSSPSVTSCERFGCTPEPSTSFACTT
jgi:hypothetical protein